MESKDFERYWERVTELLDPMNNREEDTMKTYGKAESPTDTSLVVNTDHSSIVGVGVRSPHPRGLVFLSPEEVANLIGQLSEWLLTRPIGGEK